MGGGGEGQWHGSEWGRYRYVCDLLMSGTIVVGGVGFIMCLRRAYNEDAGRAWWSILWLCGAYGSMVVRLVCFLGLLHSLREVHRQVEERLKALLSKFGDAILEVSH